MKETAYLLQAVLVGAWWVGLAASPAFFDAFQFDGVPPIAFWSFAAPDLVVIAGASILRVYRQSFALEFLILGAFAYASLFCGNATVLTGSGYLPTTLMLLGLAYNLFLCFGDASFRPASSGFGWNVAKTAVQIVCVWTATLVLIPWVILDAFGASMVPESSAALLVGAALFAVSSALGLASAWFMVRCGDGTPLPLDQANRLVTRGPYRYVRNPMAIAGVWQGIAVAIALGSLPILVYALLGAVVWHVVVRPHEERDLAARFGDAYRDYQQEVRCWWPRFVKRPLR